MLLSFAMFVSERQRTILDSSVTRESREASASLALTHSEWYQNEALKSGLWLSPVGIGCVGTGTMM